jgi:hypothetical protein
MAGLLTLSLFSSLLTCRSLEEEQGRERRPNSNPDIHAHPLLAPGNIENDASSLRFACKKKRVERNLRCFSLS